MVIPEPESGDQHWALIDLLLWTAFLLIVTAGAIDLVGHSILKIW